MVLPFTVISLLISSFGTSENGKRRIKAKSICFMFLFDTRPKFGPQQRVSASSKKDHANL